MSLDTHPSELSTVTRGEDIQLRLLYFSVDIIHVYFLMGDTKVEHCSRVVVTKN